MHNPELDFDAADLELVVLEVQRLQQLFPKLGRAVIRHSSECKYHIRFTGKVTWEEYEQVLCSSWLEHSGHRVFTLLCGDGTLRVSEKPKSKVEEPYTVEVL